MADKTFKVNPGDEIIITVPRKKAAEAPFSPTAAPPKAMIRASRSDEILPRRLSNIVNFYDLGQHLENGVWTDGDFTVLQIDREITTGVYDPVTEAAIRTRLNAALVIPLENWKNHFRKLDYDEAVKYRLAAALQPAPLENIDAGNPNWTRRGLRPKTAENLTIAQSRPDAKYVYYDLGGTFVRFDTLNSANDLKITASADIESPAVNSDFGLSANGAADVFLNPSLFKFVASIGAPIETVNQTGWVTIDSPYFVKRSAGYPDPDGTPNDPCVRVLIDPSLKVRIQKNTIRTHREIEIDALNYFISDWQRNTIINRDDLRIEHDTLQDNVLLLRDAVRAMKLHPQARRARLRSVNDGMTTVIRAHPDDVDLQTVYPLYTCGGTLPPDEPPTYSDETTPLPLDGFDTNAADYIAIQPLTIADTLVAAVHQGSEWFFIWRRSLGGGET